mgnify:CR=1 FL=1
MACSVPAAIGALATGRQTAAQQSAKRLFNVPNAGFSRNQIVLEGRAAVASAVFSAMMLNHRCQMRPRRSVALQITRKHARDHLKTCAQKAHKLRFKGLKEACCRQSNDERATLVRDARNEFLREHLARLGGLFCRALHQIEESYWLHAAEALAARVASP